MSLETATGWPGLLTKSTPKQRNAPHSKRFANWRSGCGAGEAFGVRRIPPLCIVLAASAVLATRALAVEAPTYKFQFGAAPAAPGFVRVSPDMTYSPDRGYGFDLGSSVRSVSHASEVSLHSGYCTSDRPFYFSVRLPEGNYNTTVTFGDATGATTNCVKAECRRLMLEDVQTAPGQFTTRTFTVNIRTPKIPGDGEVRLKPRESGPPLVLHWDDKLTLEFNGARPALCALELAPATNRITVFLLGDSTVTDQPREPWNSWGQMLTRFFKPGLAVANHAESGESLKSSLGARRVAKVLASLKPGDYVFAQFGHNDQKDKATNALATYKTNLKKLVAEVRERQGTPVLVTSMERMAGVEHDTLGPYPAAVREVASEEHVALIDLHAMSRTLYRALGPDLKKAFQDGTHHNAYGSYELAKCVVEGIRQAKLGLTRFIADNLPPFSPEHPDPVNEFHIPASPLYADLKPEGN